MHKRNSRRFSPIHVIMLLISCLTVMGCYPIGCHNPDWSDKDADFLITQLKTNQDYNLRYKAVRLLAKKTQERDKVIPALTHVLLNDEFEINRQAAIEALSSIEPPAISAIPALIEALQREDMGVALAEHSESLKVHRRAITSLGKMGPDAAEAIPALTEVFRSDEEYLRYVRDDAGLAILKIDHSMHAVKEELIERRAARQLAELAEAGDVSLVPVLIKLLNDPDPPDGATHHYAEHTLKNIGTPETLNAVVAYHIQRLDHPDPMTRVSAAESLKNIGTPEALDAAFPVLIQLLNDPETEDSERLRAARTLTDIGTPEALDAAVPAFIQLLNTPKEAKAEVRRRYARYAAEELKDIGTPEALEAVKQFEKPRWWPF